MQAYQSNQDEDIVKSKPPLDDQARIHAQPNHYHYQRDEYGVDDEECIASCRGVHIVRRRPCEDHLTNGKPTLYSGELITYIEGR